MKHFQESSFALTITQRTSNGGRILLYIWEDTSSKMLKFEPVQYYFEGFFAEINLRKKIGFFPDHITEIAKIL